MDGGWVKLREDVVVQLTGEEPTSMLLMIWNLADVVILFSELTLHASRPKHVAEHDAPNALKNQPEVCA